ncbi:MAG: GDSL-type esterase/lipase family protein [Acidobacteria bacterium]|nr:GDSL-type esterase/lipase family protein [Acidobacteriota bacterium]
MTGNCFSRRPRIVPRPGVLAAVLLALAAAAAAQTPSRCKAFGDSITAGVGDDPGRAEAGYPPRLEALVPGLVVDNRGVGAERTPEGLARIDDVLAEPGDCLLLMEGTNDISRDISAETTLFNLDQMAARAAAADWTAYHATLIPRLPNARFDPNNVQNQDLVQSIRRLAAIRGRGLVDPFEIFSTERRLFHAYYYAGTEDPVGHPNGAGYDLLASAFRDVLESSDEVPPVPTRLIPAHGAEGVSAASAVEVEVRDFGSAIDTGSASLLVDGLPAPAPGVGDDGRWLRWRFSSGEPLEGVVTLSLRVADAEGNVYDRMLGRFLVEGAVRPPGDVDRDGRVDGRDLVFLGLAFGAGSRSHRFDADADLDGSGQVDGEDLAILAANFGASL